ncbi:MAG: inositol monophosphatase [Simkaniaceae bacterium]|nr:inositol monophosphatase [Simkaniaceae bacterium]
MIDTYCDLAVELALAAGDILREGFGTTFKIKSKDGRHDLVTEFDERVEEMILGQISKRHPDHSILAEESGLIGEKRGGVKWIVDPLDGTVNFAHGIPMFSVSIAVAVDDEVEVGVIHNPMTSELFVGKRGQGAKYNNEPMQVTTTNRLTDSILATGFPYNVAENPHHCIDQFAHIAKLGIPIRRIGSAAIDLAYVAAGKFDAFWEVILNPWDFAAGVLLVREAGGNVTDLDGNPLNMFERGPIVATNTLLHEQAIEHLKYYEEFI